MLVDHLSFSTNGGAGIVGSLLVKGQVALGVSAQMNAITQSNLWDAPFSHPSLTIRSAIDKYLIASSQNAPMFSLARRAAKSKNYKPRPGAILHLHWTEGVFRRQRIVEWLAAGHDVVFTLHDMSPFTGGCHQSLGCNGFESRCQSCPQVKPIFRTTVESRFTRSISLSEFRNQIAVVAPTSWMRDQAIRSRQFSKFKVEIIENPIDPAFFRAVDRRQIRKELVIPEDAFVAVSVAAQVNNPAKRIKDCIQAFTAACEEAGAKGVFVLVGEGADDLAMRYPIALSAGPGGPEHVAQALAASDVLLSGSVAESAGMTIREASAQGVAAIAVSNGGSDDMISDQKTGFVVSDFEKMKAALVSLMTSDLSMLRNKHGQQARKMAHAKAGLDSVSRQYIDLYRDFDSNKVVGK